VLADDLLFATLDPTSRRLELPSGKLVILTDTVGFIQKLPTELVEAFAATLEEVRQAHMLCLVVDASHPDAEQQLVTVLETLRSMECEQPMILALSKVDRLTASEVRAARLRLGDIAGVSALAVSATKGTGLRELRQRIDGLAAQVVPDIKANRPSAASQAVPPEAEFHAAAG
jgi:GTP-binding protein HflX